MLETPGQMAEPNPEDVAAPGVDPEAPAPSSVEADPIEAIALEKGWSRKEDWRGPEEAWKPAADFIRTGLERGREASRDIRSMKDTMQRTELALHKLHERTVQEVRREAEQKYLAAVDSKDPVAAAEAFKEYQAADKPAAPAAPPSEVSDFQSRNAWFGSNPRATALAQGVAEDAARAGKTAAEQIAEAEKEVRRVYPHLFSDAPAPAKPPASVASPTSRAAAPGKREKGFSELPVSAQETGRRMSAKMGFTLEDFAKTWHAENQA